MPFCLCGIDLNHLTPSHENTKNFIYLDTPTQSQGSKFQRGLKSDPLPSEIPVLNATPANALRGTLKIGQMSLQRLLHMMKSLLHRLPCTHAPRDIRNRSAVIFPRMFNDTQIIHRSPPCLSMLFKITFSQFLKKSSPVSFSACRSRSFTRQGGKLYLSQRRGEILKTIFSHGFKRRSKR